MPITSAVQRRILSSLTFFVSKQIIMTSGYLSTYQIPIITTSDTQQRQVWEAVTVNATSPSKNSNTLHSTGKERPSVRLQNVPIVQKETKTNAALAAQRKLKRKMCDPMHTEVNNLVLFQGRDESYPDELNKLIQPLSCQLCMAQMTSMKSAKDHYESKAHDRHISAWLAKNYTQMGLDTPPIKRLVQQGPTGPNAFHCNLCDLALTSITHARQHYAGRKHQLVMQKRSKPSGAGYYNAEGNWVRTGTKADSIIDDGRFGIGELFIKNLGPEMHESSSDPMDYIDEQLADKLAAIDDSLTCKLCKISVTSASQIQMHMDGVKHQKNLRKLSLEEEALALDLTGDQMQCLANAACGMDANGELAMYRTPSGSYYCKLCNKAMNHISILQQHLQGKKHLKTLRLQIGKTISQ